MKTYEKPIEDIKESTYNPRTIRRDEFEALKHAVEKFGQVENLIVNKDGTLISGHMRLKAMRELGFSTATVTEVDLDKTDEKLLNLTMNNRAIAGEYDEGKLTVLLEELKLADEDEYGKFRLAEIEPLHEGNNTRDTTTMSTPDEYEEKNERQLTLIYSYSTYEELGHKLMALHRVDQELYPKNHKDMFLLIVEEEYGKSKRATGHTTEEA